MVGVPHLDGKLETFTSPAVAHVEPLPVDGFLKISAVPIAEIQNTSMIGII